MVAGRPVHRLLRDLIRRPSGIFGFSRPKARAADRKPIPFLRTEFNEFLANSRRTAIGWPSPRTGRAGAKCTCGRFRRARASGPFRLPAAEAPRWSGDGKELFFEAADGKMMAVPVKAVPGAKPSFEAGRSRGVV